MSNLTLDELLRRAKACDRCGAEHAYRQINPPNSAAHEYSWADPTDGHSYQPGAKPWDNVIAWLERQG